MFADASSFRTVLTQIGRSSRFRAVYVASHGHEAGLRNGVQVDDIIDTLRDANSSGHIRGVFLGVCSLGQPATMQEILAPRSGTNLEWLAGYSEEIEWLESAAADLLFWSGYLYSDAKAFTGRAADGVQNLMRFMPNAQHEFGFGAFKRTENRRSVVSLLDSD